MMSSLSSRLRRAAAIAALGCGLAAGARAEAVVVASSAPGYRLGQFVADGEVVRLPDGAAATFLFANGRTRRLRGPYDGALAAAAEPAGIATRAGGTDARFAQGDLGAARALGRPLDGALEHAFTLDPTASGTVCVKAGSAPLLRRPVAAMDRVVLETAGGARATVTWTGDAPVPWPATLPPVDGADIRTSGADGSPLATLHIRGIAGAGSADLAVRMAAAGCAGQAAAAMAALRDATLPIDLSVAADHGPTDAYRPGEAIRLQVRTDRDAHVYCFLRDARARLIPIFPAGASASAEITGDAPLSLPGDRMPLPLRAGDRPGDLEVRCVAASRSLDDAVPGRSAAFRPLNEDAAAQLDRAVARLPDAEVATALIVLKVR